MKKRIISALIAISLAVTTAACGQGSENTSSSTSSNTGSSESSQTAAQETIAEKDLTPVTLITPWEISQDAIDMFTEKTGIEVKQDVITGGDSAYENARNARMASGENLDIVAVNQAAARDFSSKGYLVDLSGESFWDRISDTATTDITNFFGGKRYGVSYESTALGVWYNKDIFKKYNLTPPTNFDEFINICNTLKDNGVAPLVQGGKDVWPLDQFLRLAMNQLVQTYPDFQSDLELGKIKWTDKEVVDVLKERLVTITTPEYFGSSLLGTSYDQCWQIMLQQKAAMWVMGSWAVEVMTKSNVEPTFEVGAFTAPNNAKGTEQIMVGDTFTRIFGILEKSNNKDNAKKFLAGLAEPEIAEKNIEKNLMISNVKGASSAKLPASQDWNNILTLKVGNTYVFHDEVNKVINQLLTNVVAGKMTIDEYAAQLQKAQEKDNSALKK